MKLSEILPVCNLKHDPEITGLYLNSNEVQPGGMFFAISGKSSDGHDYIRDAIKRGAACIVTEKEHIHSHYVNPNLKEQIREIANKFYGPTNSLVGVTGTNGKTTISFFLAQILDAKIIGTLGIGKWHNLQESSNTTPDLLRVYRESGAGLTVMEVSSDALEQKRVLGLNFEAVIFSNFSQDHMDTHKTMANYWQAKSRLFTDYDYKLAIVNADDVKAKELIAKIPSKIMLTSLTNIKTKFDHVNLVARSNKEDHMLLTIHTLVHEREELIKIKCPMLSDYNISNLLQAIAFALYKNQQNMDLRHLRLPPGRMEVVEYGDEPRFIVDYAHTPDALEKLLTAVKGMNFDRLILVFGCGGNRDRSKRSIMGYIAAKYSDIVILTEDNSRGECTKSIFNDIAKGELGFNFIFELERKAAIAKAFFYSKKKDIIIVAGKGHEQKPISDIALIRMVLDEFRETNSN